ncbi:MAG: carbamoyl-phosphate synthase large subunit [Sphingobacteriales bacterium]|jgi:carbamoyl-phosphate synthase large subunit
MSGIAKHKVLITGAGAPGAAGIISCLKKDPSLNLICCDANIDASGQFLNIPFFQCLKGRDKEFIPNLLEQAIEHKIDVVLPLVTSELLPFSKNIELFRAKGIKVIVSEHKALEIANNKGKLYEFLKENTVPVPQFEIVQDVEGLKKAITNLGYPKNAVCFKPCVSNGSRGFRILDTSVNQHDLLFNHKPSSTYIDEEYLFKILKDKELPELLVSEVLPGDEYSVDCLVDNGKAMLVVPRKRTKIQAGISVSGEFVKNQSIIDYCTKIVELLKLHGMIGVQVKATLGGEYRILEINPRVQGTIVAGIGAGVNLPLMAINQEVDSNFRVKETIKWGTKFDRVWKEYYH